MKKIKRLFLTLLSVCASVLLAVGLACCKDSKEIKLVGFADIDVDGALGKDFSVASYLIAVDEEENTYKGTASVTDQAGNAVELIYNRFVPTSLNPYTVKIKVSVAENDVRERTITVNVKDVSVPTYTFSFNPYTGTVGSEYVVPTATAKKTTGEEMTATMKVYLNEAGTLTEQTLTDGTFTPTKAGNYRLDAVVTDWYGMEYVKSKDFAVREKMAESMLEDFGHETSYENATGELNLHTNGPTKKSAKWHRTYADKNGEVATGVAQFMIYYANNSAAGRFNLTEEELKAMLENAQAIGCRFMITHPSLQEFTFGFFGVLKKLAVQEWSEIKISVDELIENMQGETRAEKIADFANAYCVRGTGVSKSGVRMFSTKGVIQTKVSPTIYVDSLHLSTRKAMAENVLEDFDDILSKVNATGELSFANNSGMKQYDKWNETVSDAKGEVATGVIQFNVYYTNAAAVGRVNKTADELVQIVTAMLVKGDVFRCRFKIDHPTLEECTFKFFGASVTVPVNTWSEVKVKASDVIEQMQGETIEEKIQDFATAYCSTGTGVSKGSKRMFGTGADVRASKESATVYVDEITRVESYVDPQDPHADDLYRA